MTITQMGKYQYSVELNNQEFNEVESGLMRLYAHRTSEQSEYRSILDMLMTFRQFEKDNEDDKLF